MDLSRLIDPAGRRARAEPQETRPVWFGAWVDTPVYWRDHLPLKMNMQGPAIIEQMDTTLVVEPGCRITSDSDGNLIVEVQP
jgi:N-methylhydantoinase A